MVARKRQEQKPKGRPPRMQRALGLLRAAGLRITQPRQALLQRLVDAGQPLSAEDLHRAGDGADDLVTIYRNLEAFDRAGILHRSHTQHGKSLFQLNERNQHYHLVICRSCQRAERISACGLDPLEAIAADLGFREITHHLELFGVCAKCVGSEEESPDTCANPEIVGSSACSCH